MSDKSGGNISTALLMSARFEAGELINIKEVSIGNESKIGGAHPFISPDESFLIFDKIGDMYITFLDNEGAWSPSKKLNHEINTSAYEFAPYVTPDGKYFFFTRDDNIYWVDAKILDDLKPPDQKDR